MLIEALKTCTACGQSKPRTPEYFEPTKDNKTGLQAKCRPCLVEYRREAGRKFRSTAAGRLAKQEATKRWEASEAGRKKNRAAKRAWKAKNRAKVTMLQRQARAAETPEQRQRRFAVNAAYRRRVTKENPQLRLRFSVSSRIATALKTRGTSKRGRNWEQLVGYTLAELKTHIERQFAKGMTWENFGDWHVDHIVPVASFKWSTAGDEVFRACWALTNLRPLWADDNRRKKAKRLFLL